MALCPTKLAGIFKNAVTVGKAFHIILYIRQTLTLLHIDQSDQFEFIEHEYNL